MSNLKEGQSVRFNGRPAAHKVIFVGAQDSLHLFVGVQGPRGGDVMLIPSVDGVRIQTSRGLGANNQREWIELIEITG
tara:strand:+ start:892 stop:1125 length:234 start_codon:yes stop_codon:yes gene_type:complete